MTTRRKFIKHTGIVAAGVSLVPRHVLGGKGFIAPSDKLVIAGIGVGGKGESDLANFAKSPKVNVAYLCDVDERRAAKSVKAFPKAKYYKDFRKMLETEHKHIDAVSVSTPDHMHGVQAMAAIQLGKHVYVQKPLTHDIYEARMLTEAARKYKVVTQMGNQGGSGNDVRSMKEWYDAGLIGDVTKVECWTNRPVWPQGIPVPTEKPPLPASMTAKEWDLYIGPAEYVDYHPLYHLFKWRGWWNFGTGALGDMGCHLIDSPFRVLGLGYPTEVECSVGQVFIKDWSPEFIPEGCPPSSSVQIKFPPTAKNRSEIKLHWNDGGLRPFHPDLIPADDYLGEPDSGNGVIMIGTKGTMTCGTYGRWAQVYLKDGTKLTMPDDFDGGNPNVELPEYGHQVSWTEACKAGFGSKEHKALTSSFDYSGPMTETVLMGNLAIRSYMIRKKQKDNPERMYFDGRKKLLWDGEEMKITNYDDANQFVSRPFREGWKLV